MNETRGLGDADEPVRTDRRSTPARPAQQRFHGDDDPGFCRDDRLIEDFKLLGLETVADLGLGVLLPQPLRVQFWRIDFHVGLAIDLDGVHGDIGAPEQFLRGAFGGRGMGNADAGAVLNGAYANQDRLPRQIDDGRRERSRERSRLAGRDQHREFVAAETGEEGPFRHLGLETGGDQRDQLVAGFMSIGVVDVLETVEIDKNDGGYGAGLASAAVPCVRFRRQRKTIGQLAQ